MSALLSVADDTTLQKLVAANVVKLLVQTLRNVDPQVQAQGALTVGQLCHSVKIREAMAAAGVLPLLLGLLVSQDTDVQVRAFTLNPVPYSPYCTTYLCERQGLRVSPIRLKW